VDLELTGKVFLITGGTDGIGLALAERLVGEGAHVAVCGRDADRLSQAQDRLGGDALCFEADVTNPVQLDEFLSFRDCAFPKVDFKYDVNGSTYNSDNMKLGVACPSADLMVTALGNRYAPGKKIQVHYDPNDPGRSAALNISYMPKNSAVMKWLFFSTLFVFALIRYLYKFWEEAH